MKLTPLDIHHKEFGHGLRGYNEAEVDAFLDQVADELERLFKENINLSERLEALEQKVREYQDMERTLHNTLLSAQRSSDELMEKTEHEAAVVLKDAEVKAKEVIHGALTQKQKATNDLARIKQAEEEFRASFKSLLEKHLRSIEEIPLAEDVKLMVGRAGTETVAEAEVSEWEPEPATIAVAIEEPAVFSPEPEVEEPAVPEVESELAEPETTEAESAEPEVAEPEVEEPESEKAKNGAVVASLHLGEVEETPLPPDTAVEFDVAEFGYGEREEDVDIEEID